MAPGALGSADFCNCTANGLLLNNSFAGGSGAELWFDLNGKDLLQDPSCTPVDLSHWRVRHDSKRISGSYVKRFVGGLHQLHPNPFGRSAMLFQNARQNKSLWGQQQNARPKVLVPRPLCRSRSSGRPRLKYRSLLLRIRMSHGIESLAPFLRLSYSKQKQSQRPDSHRMLLISWEKTWAYRRYQFQLSLVARVQLLWMLYFCRELAVHVAALHVLLPVRIAYRLRYFAFA